MPEKGVPGYNRIAAVARNDVGAPERCCDAAEGSQRYQRGTALMLERQRIAATLEKIADMQIRKQFLLSEEMSR